MKYLFFLGFIVAGFLIISCQKDVIRGEGNTIVEDRTAQIKADYQTIQINGATDVFVKYGTEAKLEVKGYANLLNIYCTEIKNKRLELGYKNNYNVRNDNIKVYITAPFVPDVKINGSAEIHYEGAFPGQENLSATINGSGNITYSSIGVKKVRFSINGASKVIGKSLISDEAVVNISGSGEVTLTVNEKLNVNMSGSGVVYYKGQPVINQEISGSGKIISLN